jgi:hypothetical protein
MEPAGVLRDDGLDDGQDKGKVSNPVFKFLIVMFAVMAAAVIPRLVAALGTPGEVHLVGFTEPRGSRGGGRSSQERFAGGDGSATGRCVCGRGEYSAETVVRSAGDRGPSEAKELEPNFDSRSLECGWIPLSHDPAFAARAGGPGHRVASVVSDKIAGEGRRL